MHLEGREVWVIVQPQAKTKSMIVLLVDQGGEMTLAVCTNGKTAGRIAIDKGEGFFSSRFSSDIEAASVLTAIADTGVKNAAIDMLRSIQFRRSGVVWQISTPA